MKSLLNILVFMESRRRKIGLGTVKELRKKNRNSTKFKGLIIAFLFSFTLSAVVCPCTLATSMWSKTYGGTQDDWGYYLIQSSDGGYAMEGYTRSFGGYKVYLVKADASGNMQWNKTYAISTLPNIGHYAIQTADGGYAIVGWTYISGQDQDFTLYKTDSTGNLEWNMTYGGAGVENGYALLQDSDGGYVLTGNTDSFGAGGSDIWLVKTDESGVVPEGLTLGVMLLMSAVAVIVGASYFRKRPKIKTSGQVKL
jgi:predicted secreted protein